MNLRQDATILPFKYSSKFNLTRFTVIILALTALAVLPFTLPGQSIQKLDQQLENASTQDERKRIILQLNAHFLREYRENALPYLDTLIQIGLRQNDYKAVASGLVSKGTVLYYTGDLKKSSEFYYEALENTEDTPGYYSLRVRILNNIGWNYQQLEDNQRALSMFREAMKYGRMAGNDTLLGGVLNNMAVVLKDLEDYENALITLEESIEINWRLEREEQVRFNLNNMGVVLTHMNRNEQAIDTLKKVLAMNYEKADTTEIANNLLNLGTAFYNLGKPDSANHYLVQAMLTAKDERLRRKIYFTFDKVMVSKNDYKNALDFWHKFYLVTDSINNTSTRRHLIEMDAKYESLVKQRDLEKAQINLANQRTLMYVIVGALLIFVVLAAFLLYLVRLKNKNEHSLREMNTKFSKQAKELSESNKQIREINDSLESIVKERTAALQKQNARLLHFSFLNSHRIRGPIASLLGLVNILYEERNSEIEDTVRDHLHSTATRLDNMVREVTKKLEEEELDEK